MQNKKIKGSIALLAVVSVLVGGSYAWLGSTDNIINVFKTEPGKGSVEIYEHFNSEEALVMKTGVDQAINKEVQIRIRPRMVKHYETLGYKMPLKDNGKIDFLINILKLNFFSSLKVSIISADMLKR